MENNVEKGILSDEKTNSCLMKNVTQIQRLNIKDDFVIAKYDKSIVTTKHKKIWNNKLLSMFNLKYFTRSILGKTWHILLMYLVMYYIIQTLYQLGYLTTFCKNHMFFDPENHDRM